MRATAPIASQEQLFLLRCHARNPAAAPFPGHGSRKVTGHEKPANARDTIPDIAEHGFAKRLAFLLLTPSLHHDAFQA
jgi:hypothetical protein